MLNNYKTANHSLTIDICLYHNVKEVGRGGWLVYK